MADVVAAKDAPTAAKSETELKDELLAEARKRFEMCEDAEREDRKLAAEDFAFAAGSQWPDTIMQQRQNDGRPCLQINRLPQFIKQITGEARQNPVAIKVHPVDSEGDIDTADIFAGLIRNIEAQSSATQSYITALDHAVRGGFGHWRIVTEEPDDGFEQDIRIKRIINPFAVYWDCNAKDYCKQDAEYCFVVERMTKEAFEAKYPDKSPNDWALTYQNIGQGGMSWYTVDSVMVAEYWKKVPVTKTIGKLDNGAVVDLTDVMDHLAMIPLMQIPDGGTDPLTGEPTTKPVMKQVQSHKIVCHKLTAHDVLDDNLDGWDFPSKFIPILSVYGPEEFIGDRIRHVSLVRYAKDPQRMYNYWQSSITEKIALAPKSPFIGTTEQFAGHENEWDRANVDNKSRLTYNHQNGVNPPQRQHPADINEAEIIQSKTAIDDMKATMGLYDPSLGKQSNETSGRAILARQAQGNNATFDWTDNLARTIEQCGRILVDMIPKIYDTPRVIRVLGNDESARMVQINQDVAGEVINDLTVGKYDIVISVGPSYATKRIESAESLMALVNSAPQIAQVAGDLLAKSLDIPFAEEIANRLEKALPPGMVDPKDLTPEEQQQMMQAQQDAAAKQAKIEEIGLKEKMAEIENKVANTSLVNAQADKLRADTEKTRVDTRAQDIENDMVLNESLDLIPTTLYDPDLRNGQTDTSSRAA